MVYRTDSDVQATTLADPALFGKRVGVIAQTPPANLLAFYGLSNIQPYQLNVDTRADQPARHAIEDVASGEDRPRRRLGSDRRLLRRPPGAAI